MSKCRMRSFCHMIKKILSMMVSGIVQTNIQINETLDIYPDPKIFEKLNQFQDLYLKK